MFNFLTALGKGKTCLREEPFLRFEGILLATNYVSQFSDVLATSALNRMVGSRDALSHDVVCGLNGNGAERSSRIEGDQAFVFDRLANTKRLASDLHVVELDAKHVLELDVMPVEFTAELARVVIAERQVRLVTHASFFLPSRQVESEHVARQKMLVHHLIENRSDTLLGESWISHTDDSFEVITGEDGLLSEDVSELLLRDVNLAARHAIARAQADVIKNEVSGKRARAELDEGPLLGLAERR